MRDIKEQSCRLHHCMAIAYRKLMIYKKVAINVLADLNDQNAGARHLDSSRTVFKGNLSKVLIVPQKCGPDVSILAGPFSKIILPFNKGPARIETLGPPFFGYTLLKH